MGTRGPKPAVRNADGTRRRSEVTVIGGVNDLEPLPHLPEHVQVVWRELVEPMRGAAILDRVDAPALEAMSRSVARWREAEQLLDVEGMFVSSPNGYRVAHPAIAVAQKAQTEYRNWCARFGLTPSDRVGLGMAVIRGKSLAQDLADKIGPSPRMAG
jgi:P27 family predicted phage terminase small subunit